MSNGYVSEAGWLLVDSNTGSSNTRNIGELVVTDSVPKTVIGKSIAPTALDKITHIGSRLVLHVQVGVGVYLQGTSELTILCAVLQPQEEGEEGKTSFMFQTKTLGSLEVGDRAVILNTLNVAQKQLFFSPVTQIEPYGFEEVYDITLEDPEESSIVNGFVVR